MTASSKKGTLETHHPSRKFYWELVRVAEKLLIMASYETLNDNLPLMCQLALLVVLSYGALSYTLKPYLLKDYNRIDIISSFCSFFTIYITMITLTVASTSMPTATVFFIVLCIPYPSPSL